MSFRELLQTKAEQISTRCVEVGLTRPIIRVVSDYAVDLYWSYEGKKHTLSINWSPKRQQWTPVSKTDWVQREIMPVIAPLLNSPVAGSTPTPPQVKGLVAAEPPLQLYFADAYDGLKRLEPFAQDNIDCAIICHRAKEAINLILDDPACIHLNRAALIAKRNEPDRSNFFGAKEYFTQCLTLCNISSMLS